MRPRALTPAPVDSARSAGLRHVTDDGAGITRKMSSLGFKYYLREISGEDFTAKDFRTWASTVLACTALREMAMASPHPRPASTHVARAIDAVAGILGNTRTVCRKSYIHPGVIDAYISGTMARSVETQASRRRAWLSADECAALAILRLTAPSRAKRAA